MGRTGSGIEVRETSIRLTFTFEGKPRRETIMVDGKPLAPTPANIKFANRLAGEIRDRIKYGTFTMAEYFPASGTTSGITVSARMDVWLGTQRVEESTRAGYDSAVKFWKESLSEEDSMITVGQRGVRALILSHILYALARRPDLSGKTVNNYVSVLRQALKLAVADRVIKENPADGVPRAIHQKEPPDPLTREEADAICKRLDRNHPGQVANLVKFWFWTGLRTSEVFALTWESIDLRSGKAVISQAKVRGVHKDRTKTNTVRTVSLNSMAMAALKDQREHSQMAGGIVFKDPRVDKAWDDERAFRRSFWTPTLKVLGIRYRRPYQMRHTYATQMLMAGMTPAFCARQLGHSVEMFLRTYTRWLDGDQNDREMQRLEIALQADSSLILPQEKKKRT